MKHTKWLALPLALSLIGAGCVPRISTTPAAPGTTTGGAADRVAVSGGCTNRYYPLTPGLGITYRTNSAGTTGEYSWRVLPSSGSTQKVEITFTTPRTVTLTQEFTCEGGRIRALGYLDMSAISGSGIAYTTDSVEGEFFPANMDVGTTWSTTYHLRYTISDARMAALMGANGETTAVITNKVIGEESVTVPAGTFTALKVEQKYTSTLTVSGRPITTSFTSYNWVVRDIGMVKSSAEGPGSSITEAISITRP